MKIAVEEHGVAIRNKKRALRSKKRTIRKVNKKVVARHRSKKTTMSKTSVLEESGLIGCLTGTGITSTNYKDLLYKE
jgi:hypothetical protein